VSIAATMVASSFSFYVIFSAFVPSNTADNGLLAILLSKLDQRQPTPSPQATTSHSSSVTTSGTSGGPSVSTQESEKTLEIAHPASRRSARKSIEAAPPLVPTPERTKAKRRVKKEKKKVSSKKLRSADKQVAAFKLQIRKLEREEIAGERWMVGIESEGVMRVKVAKAEVDVNAQVNGVIHAHAEAKMEVPILSAMTMKREESSKDLLDVPTNKPEAVHGGQFIITRLISTRSSGLSLIKRQPQSLIHHNLDPTSLQPT
jgi:hypothetical protein